MAQFENREEFLNALFDHIYGEDGEDEDGFFEHLASFFEDEESNNSSTQHRRHKKGSNNSNKVSPPRRQRRTVAAGNGYGSSKWFGT